MKQVLQATGVANISDASDTSQYSIEAPAAGVLRVDQTYIRWTEATGSQTSTQGVVSLEVAGVEVATLTANQSDGIGETQTFTGATTDTNGTVINAIDFAAGADIEVVVKTQAVGGTITGDGDVFLSLGLAL